MPGFHLRTNLSFSVPLSHPTCTQPSERRTSGSGVRWNESHLLALLPSAAVARLSRLQERIESHIGEDANLGRICGAASGSTVRFLIHTNLHYTSL